MTAFTNTNILMMYQFFQQAEKWHLRLNADISEMQNKELLQEVEKYKSDYNLTRRLAEKKKLAPINDCVTNDFAEMLHKRLEQLESHNCKLQNDFKCLEDNYDKVDIERQALKQLVQDNHTNVNTNLCKQSAEIEVQTLSISEDNTTHDYEECVKTKDLLEADLKSTQSQLTLANMELERKFNDTAAYVNMKKIIQKKNEQVRELRDRLLVYEKDDGEENFV
ncbi:leucine zipper transcription factor-like protein 1 isoform X1 [Adelges cooleyi]|nr:leucine zipper transcription factor-like protein 1 isoform X1 [Adelges cooleyi]